MVKHTGINLKQEKELKYQGRLYTLMSVFDLPKRLLLLRKYIKFITYAVSVVSRTLENPSSTDVVKVKRIFRYIKGTIDSGISYKKGYTPDL